MTHRKSPKKTETVEIRLSHTAKTAFMARCRAQGMTASEAIRRFIDADRGDVRVAPWRQIWIAAVAGLALGAVAAPSLAQSLSPSRAAFDRLDRDRNGVVTFEEFRAR
ncbi:EF-hand domain-containing protein [Brevundimonas diminuta]